MSIAALVSLLVSLAKVIPALDSILQQANAAMVEHRRTAANAQTDEDLARVQAAPWRCPGTCPHRVLYNGPEQPPAPAGQS